MSEMSPVCRLVLLVSGLVAGSMGSDRVEQTSGLPVEMGHPTQMDCSQDLGGEYLAMSWYLRRPGEGLKLMAYTVPYSSQPDFGELSHSKYSATKHEAQRGRFTVKEFTSLSLALSLLCK